MQSNAIWTKRAILFFHLILIIVFFKFAYIGHYGFDDMQYAEIASNLLNGKIDFEDHFSFRFTIIFFTALSYAIFGISDFASALPSMILSGIILLIVYKVLKKEKVEFLFTALSLSLLSEWFLAYSNKLMPDIYLASFLCLAIYFFWNYKFQNKSVRSYSFWMALSLFFAFNSKGTIVLAIPLFVYFIAISFRSRSERSFWFHSILYLVILFAIYFATIEYFTGSFFKRFEAIYSNAYLNRCSYDQQSVTILLKRLFKDLFGLFQREGMLAPFIFLPLMFFIPKKLSEVRFWGFSALILILSSNFMTISLSSYNPMCLDARHYLFLSPIGAIAAARLLPAYFKIKRARVIILLLFVIIACYSYYDDNSALSIHYLPILIGLGISIKFNNKPWVFAIFLFIGLSIKPFKQVLYAQDVKYFEQEELIRKDILPIVKDNYLICNKVQARILRYYQGFMSNGARLLVYPDFNFDTLDLSKDIFLLENGHTRGLMFYNWNDLPFYIKNPSAKNEVLLERRSPQLRLIKMNEFVDPEKTGKIIFESVNDFEKSYEHWNQNEIHLQNKVVKDGNNSILCPEYSSTLTIAVDSLFNDSSAFYIKTSVDFWVSDLTEAAIIISIENEDGSWSYNNQKLEDAVISYSNWANQTLSSYIKVSDYKKNSILKVYIYNPSLNTIYLDNFEISIKEV